MTRLEKLEIIEHQEITAQRRQARKKKHVSKHAKADLITEQVNQASPND